MLRVSLSFAPVLVLVLTAHGFGQCGSSKSYQTYSVRSLPTQPVAASSVRAPQVLAVRTAPQSQATAASRTVLTAAKTRQLAKIPPRKPEEIRSAANGSWLRIAMDTQDKPRGMVILSVGGVSLLITPVEWNADSVLIQLPQVVLSEPRSAKLFIAATPQDLLQRIEFQIAP